jgi:hypothetical protein
MIGGAAHQTPRQENDSPAPRDKGAEILGFSGLTDGFNGVFDALARCFPLSPAVVRRM